MKSDLRTSFSTSVAVACEAGATLLTYHLYPLGFLHPKVRMLPKLGQAPAFPGRPILFVHGLCHNSAAFQWMRQRLQWAGWKKFGEVSIFHTLRSIPKNAAKIASAVEDLRKKYDTDQIDIIAHSMGGLISRFYIQCLGGEKHTRNLITLGTPHQGVHVSKWMPLPFVREISPSSRTLTLLKRCRWPEQTRLITISGNLDLVTEPTDAGFFSDARNYHLKNVGHAGLLFSKRAVEIITSHLKET